ncbi:hypothetical protein [Phreatobacter stygius]|uniref:aspartate-alanine antiporter-like transporter n=1 Tax=Phreatobacter stygius TaxID=1940610 RepID=UPI001476A26D|nr:hypothetical protein [Phreatobacter stygius]
MAASTGDVLTLAGPADRLAATVPLIGTLASQGNRADIAFLAAGLLSGVLIGLLSLTIKGLPVTLSAGGGALIAGLAFGWCHARRPADAPVPPAATQIMWDFGLASFCALVGRTAGPQAASALGRAGLTILVAGVVVTLLPQLAGAQTQDAAHAGGLRSRRKPGADPRFHRPYAIGNIVLTVLGPAIVALT